MKALVFICFALVFINLSSAVKLSPLKFDQDVCFVHSYDKGVPSRPIKSDCDDGFEDGFDRCWEKCRPGLIAEPDDRYCHTPCPKGFVMASGMYICVRPTAFYNDDMKDFVYATEKGLTECEKVHGKCANAGKTQVGKDFYIMYKPYCEASSQLNTTNDCVPETQQRSAKYFSRDYRCFNGLEKIGDLCYPKCDAGFESLGDVCAEPCPKGYLRCGNVCTNGTSCENGKVQRIQAAVYAIEEVILKESFEIDLGNMMCRNQM